MVFNNTTSKEDSLYHDTLFHLGLPSSDTTTFPVDPDFTRSANYWTRRAATLILKADKEWNYDDSNNSDLPVLEATLVDGQSDYSLPATVFQLLGVSVKDSGGNWHKLEPISNAEIPGDPAEHYSTSGLPRFYEARGYSIYLYPPAASSSVTLTDGLKIFLTRDIDPFAVSDTTKEPGFPRQFHRYVSYGAALDFASRRDMNSMINSLKEGLQEIEVEIRDWASSKHVDRPTGVRPQRGELNRSNWI